MISLIYSWWQRGGGRIADKYKNDKKEELFDIRIIFRPSFNKVFYNIAAAVYFIKFIVRDILVEI